MSGRFDANYDENSHTLMLEGVCADYLFIRLSQPDRCILKALWHELDYEKLSKDWEINPEVIKEAQADLYKRLWLDAIE